MDVDTNLDRDDYDHNLRSVIHSDSSPQFNKAEIMSSGNITTIFWEFIKLFHITDQEFDMFEIRSHSLFELLCIIETNGGFITIDIATLDILPSDLPNDYIDYYDGRGHLQFDSVSQTFQKIYELYDDIGYTSHAQYVKYACDSMGSYVECEQSDIAELMDSCVTLD